MNKDFFYSNLDENTLSKEKKDFLHNLKEYSELSKKQIYVLNKPLFVKKDYKYEEAVAVFISKFKILFLNFNSAKENEFEIFIDDYIEDLGYISEKYDYKDELERPRIWKNELTNKTIYSKEKSLEEILNKIEIDKKMFYEDKSSSAVKKAYDRDLQIAQEMNVTHTPSLVIFDNSNQPYGLLLASSITAETIAEICNGEPLPGYHSTKKLVGTHTGEHKKFDKVVNMNLNRY